MPHCIIEYSSPLTTTIALSDIIDAVFQGACDSALFTISDIKLRAQRFEHYHLAGEQSAFVHVNVKILSGRSDAQKQCLSEAVSERLGQLPFSDTLVTIEVNDIDRLSYRKTALAQSHSTTS